MSTYPVTYHQSPAIDRNRLTVFFRLIMVIPHAIWAVFYGIGAFVVVFFAWFAILFTGRYPAGMYNFVAGYVRFIMRFNGYLFLAPTSSRRSTAASIPTTPSQCTSRRRRRASAG